MKKLIMSLTLALLTTGAFAGDPVVTMKTIQIKLSPSDIVPKGSGITGDVAGAGSGGPGDITGGLGGLGGGGLGGTGMGAFDRIGQVLSTASTVVALGEQVYTLVQHGKPSATTDFAPISVVPKDPITKEIVSPFDMEDCSMPVRKKFQTIMTTGGVEVVRFEYMVIYSYNCSYEGVGKYIQTAFIQPVLVKAGYGWDFNATMKLSGIMNHGKKADPIVGALLTIKYSMNSWRTAFERNDTVHITGKGELKTYSN